MSTTELKDPSGLEDELWNVHERTRTNGNVMAEVTDYTRAGNHSENARRMVIRYKLPNGTTGNERFKIPVVDSDEFEIVRLLNEYGYSIAQIEELPGTDIEVAYNGGKYEIVIPQPTKSRRESLSGAFSPSRLASGGLMFFFCLTVVQTVGIFVSMGLGMDQGSPTAAKALVILPAIVWLVLFGVFVYLDGVYNAE